MIQSQSILLGLGWRKNGYRTTMLTDHLDTSKTDEDDQTRRVYLPEQIRRLSSLQESYYEAEADGAGWPV